MPNTKHNNVITLSCGKVGGCCLIDGPKATSEDFAKVSAYIKANLCESCDGSCFSGEGCSQQDS